MKLIERENEVLNVIKKLSESKLDFIVVGGYAVSALARHRFSVDCDFVIPKELLKVIEDLLVEAGYKKSIEKAGFDTIYGGFFVSYEKKINDLPVTVDLLVGSLVSRSTDASWSFDYMKQNSTAATIGGMQASVECKIPKRELLVAMKIHSARRTDIRDIIMLNEKVNWSEVFKHSKRGEPEKLKGQLDKIIQTLNDERLVDSLKGIFTLKQDVKEMITKTMKDMEELRSKIS